MDFAGLLRTTWQGFIREIVSLVLFTLVGFALCLTIVLIPSVLAGWFRGMLVYAREDQTPRLEELWSFEDYGQTLLLILVSGLLILIGYLLLIVPGVILHVWWLYALFFVVDRKLSFIDAMRASRAAVGRTGFFDHLVVLLILVVIGAIANVSVLAGLLTTPFSILLLALVYEDVSGAEEEAAPAPEAPVV